MIKETAAVERSCVTCKHRAPDLEDLYCAHPRSLAETPFGRGLYYMRMFHDRPCGPEGSLWEERK